MHVILMSQTDSESFSRGNKRRLYTLLVIAVAQPLLMWWLTRRLAPTADWTVRVSHHVNYLVYWGQLLLFRATGLSVSHLSCQ